MDHINRRLLLAGMGVVGVAALTRAARGGPINPPTTPVSPTNKTLAQVEPRIPISTDTTPGDSQAVFVISSPGSYYLTSNIVATTTRSAIKVTAPDVTIDLSGFRITSSSTTRPAISISPTTTVQTNTFIRNGSIFVTGANIISATSSLLTLENLNLASDTFSSSSAQYIAANSIIARACAFTFNDGKVLIASEIDLSDCDLIGNAQHIRISLALSARNTRFNSGQIVALAPCDSISLNACSLQQVFVQQEAANDNHTTTLRDCTIRNSSLFVRALNALGCSFYQGNAQVDFAAVSDSTLTNFSLLLRDGGRVERCSFRDAFRAIYATGPTIIDNCHVSRCFGAPPSAAAIQLGRGGHRVTNNIIDNNAAGILLTSAVSNFPSFIANNTLTRNTQGNLINLSSDAATAFTSVAAINSAATPSPFANIVN